MTALLTSTVRLDLSFSRNSNSFNPRPTTNALDQVVNIYTARDGEWSVTAKVTAIVIGACVFVMFLLFLLYNQWALARVRKTHNRQVEMESDHEGETVGEKVNRIAHKPALEPGSVV